MLWAIQGGGVLLLLSVFFAYVLAPAVAGLRRRVRIGRRKRPLSRAVSLSLLYAVLFVPGTLAWRLAGEGMTQWVGVTAPAAVDHLFGGPDFAAFERLIARWPLPSSAGPVLGQRLERAMAYIEREARSTLNDLISAAQYAEWLAVAPVLAFLLLTGASGFQRSALRVLPHGHVQWRAEEYLRDINSALAGYVRAQTAAAVIVGSACIGGFALLRIPSALSMGIAAGVLELVPAIGPLTAMLMAVTQADDHVVAVLAFLGALRLAQDYIIYPRLIQRGMHMSTPAVILTIWCGAALGGAAGVILAIPVAAFLSVSLRHWREYRDIERLVHTSTGRKPPTEHER
jgi:predicted PurR-regulated permease PerM